MKSQRGEDRRIKKTRTLLHGALVELVREKPYDSISLKEILDRANVGRSTFYTHFRDKDELLVHGIHEMIQQAETARPRASSNAYDAMTWFSTPIFEFHYLHRHDGSQRMGPRGRGILHEHLTRELTRAIGERLRKEFPGSQKSGRMPADLLARYLASTFVLVLDWWVENRNPPPPQEADTLFRALVLPVLERNFR